MRWLVASRSLSRNMWGRSSSRGIPLDCDIHSSTSLTPCKLQHVSHATITLQFPQQRIQATPQGRTTCSWLKAEGQMHDATLDITHETRKVLSSTSALHVQRHGQRRSPCARREPQHTAPSCCMLTKLLPPQCEGRKSAPQWPGATQPVCMNCLPQLPIQLLCEVFGWQASISSRVTM